MHGATAAYVSQWLADTPVADRPKLAAELGAPSFPGLQLHLLATDAQVTTGVTLVRYGVRGAAAAQRTRALDLALYPAELGKNYAVLPARTTPLLFGYAQDLRVRVAITSDVGTIRAANDSAAASKLVQFQRTSSLVADRFVVNFGLRSTPGVLQPNDYAAFARTVREADTAELLRLTR